MTADLDREITNHHFRVVLFGSARIKEGTKAYRQIYALARMIGAEGFDIVTGGGPGLMDAAMSGHNAGRKDASVHEIGLQIKLPNEQRDSSHFDIKEEFSRFSPRLDTFMLLGNAIVVAPGGVGTLLELAYTWQLMQVQQTCKVPVILLGDMWPEFIAWIKKWPLKHKLLNKEDLDLLYLAKDEQEAMRLVKLAHEIFMRNGTNVPLPK